MKLEISSSLLSFLARYLLHVKVQTGEADQTGSFSLPDISEFSFIHGGLIVKIQNKSKMIISLCLLIALSLFLVSHLQEKNEPVVYKRPLSASRGLNVNSMTVNEVSDLYCGILLMPKSMLPKLEKISQYRFAEDIKILPAKIEWNDGCMVAVAEDSTIAENGADLDQADGKDVRLIDGQPENFAGRDKQKFNPALLYFFIANASKSQINY